MNRSTVVKALAVTLAPVITLATGCTAPGTSIDLIDMVTETSSVDPGGAAEVDVFLDMGIGTFTISGGAPGLMDAKFTYNVAEWKPTVEYGEHDGKGVLRLTQPELGSKSVPDGAENRWDVMLTGDVPLSIHLESGVGEIVMNLDGVKISRLEIDQGVGSLDVDLGSSVNRDADVTIDGGIGELILTIPESVGVKLDADVGIGSLTAPGMFERGGSYVNESYGTAEVNVRVRIDAGIGSVTVNTGGRRTTVV